MLRKAAESPGGRITPVGYALDPAAALARKGLLVQRLLVRRRCWDFRINRAGRAMLCNPIMLAHERSLKRRGIYRDLRQHGYWVASCARRGRSPDEVYQQVLNICALLNELRELGGRVPPREDPSDPKPQRTRRR